MIVNKGVLTTYVVSDIEDFDEFLNKLFHGMAYYKRKNPDFTFKISCDDKRLILKTFYRNGSSN